MRWSRTCRLREAGGCIDRGVGRWAGMRRWRGAHYLACWKVAVVGPIHVRHVLAMDGQPD